MAHKSHVVFIVPDGVGIKNYLYSEVLKHLGKTTKITIWSPLDQSAFKEVLEIHPERNIQYKSLKLHKEPMLTRLYREASTFARLTFFAHKTKNETLLLNWHKTKNNIKLKLLYKMASFIGAMVKSNYHRILALEKKSKMHWPKSILKYYRSELKFLRPDHIFITHQRVSSLMPICLAAKSAGITTTTAIFSWDNLPKARLCVDTEFYALWSDWMKKDMRLFYPEIEESKLKVVGTPQFEFYKQNDRIINRDDFAKNYNIDPHKKWICFSGDDELTSPYDPNYLKDIAEVVANKHKDVQIIFRRCPVDFTNRYDDVLIKYSDIIVSIDPMWQTDSKSWVGYYSKVEDIDLQVNLAHHCEGVINLGSTMALDFASLNKPCYYLNYDTVNDPSWSTDYIYKYHHFRTMEGFKPVGWINKRDDIDVALKTMINNHDEVLVDVKKWMERIVLFPIEKNSEKLAKLLV